MSSLIFYLLIIICRLISFSKCCSIFSSLNCSCFQSNNDFNSNFVKKTFSHLYCQGNLLTNKTFQFPYGLDFKNENYFRTISIEIHHENHLEILSHHFDPLAMLFSQTNFQIPIDISLRFIGFETITFHEKSLSSSIFLRKHQTKRLHIYLIPKQKNLTEFELNDENSSNLDNQFNFHRNCFSNLIVSQLTFYIHTYRDHFSSKYSFEQIFNNTNIGELHFHGSIFRPKIISSIDNERFYGQIRSLKLHRYVDIIDSSSFPYYPQVNSYTIHSIQAHSMNLSSFLSYKNLRALEIIKPHFSVSINQFLPTLDSLTLDIEELNEKTLLIARHIYNLKLGSQLRSIDRQVYKQLSRLHNLDFSQIDLSQMISDSRCHLIEYLSSQINNQQLNIIYPEMKYLNECNCARIYLEHIQSIRINQSICLNLCYLNDCPIISQFFKEKYLLINQSNINEFIPLNSIDFNEQIEVVSDLTDKEIINFLINQTSEQEKSETQRRPTSISIDLNNISVIENIQEYDDISVLELTTNESIQEKFESFSWFAFFIGMIFILFLFLTIILIILLIIRYRKKHNFKPVPVYV